MTGSSNGGSSAVTDRGTGRLSGADGGPDDARAANLEAAKALSDLVRTTLGPNGMDKMLVGDGRIVVTNDGGSILDRVDIDHPTAAFVLGVAESQSENAFDGTTTAVVLTAALLERGVELIDRGFHPTTVVAGYRRAARVATTRLTEVATPVTDDPDALAAVGHTAITGKWDGPARRRLADLAGEIAAAAYRDGRVWRRTISVVAAAGGTVHDAERYSGLVVDTDTSSTAPKSRALSAQAGRASVALVDGGLAVETPTAVERVAPDSPEQLTEFHEYEAGTYREKARQLADLGVDVVFCQQAVDDRARGPLDDVGVAAVEQTRRDELFKLARATGATPVASVGALDTAATGVAERLRTETLGGTEYIFLTGNPHSRQTTVVLRGATDRIAEETADAFRTGLNAAIVALERGAVVPGGGASEVAAALAVETDADGVGDRRSIPAESFADALVTVPRTLAETAGVHPLDVLPALRRRHAAGDHEAGFDTADAEVVDTAAAGIRDPLEVKTHAVEGAVEAATALLRVDGVVDLDEPLGGAAEDHDDHDHDHDTGPGTLHADPEGYPWAIGH
jgi:chaperonin GroEL (HSP60 family)